MSKYEKLLNAEKEGGVGMKFKELPLYSVFMPFKKGAKGSLKIKIDPADWQIKKAGIIPDPRFGYAIDLETTLQDSFYQSTPEFFERYSSSVWFMAQIRDYELNHDCTFLGLLSDLFPGL